MTTNAHVMDDEMSDTDCEHDWHLFKDWGGDPNVVNGTFEIKAARCSICGDTTEDGDILFGLEPDEPDYREYERGGK